ncbi:MAG TPA: MerR family transcriptional regulator [Ktedonobacterales bacterium]|nr:MerR family transcriptional regulator [Ktedonobacterales bacterium]
MPRKPYGPRRRDNLNSVPKYSIAVASDLSGVPQQQLRRLEESGLITPQRTDGKTRRYSDDDMTQIAEVGDLANEGINAAGILYIRRLRVEMEALRAENEALRQQLAALRDALQATQHQGD